MPADLELRAGLVIPGGELRESASRSGGPGGQHVNKTATRVTLRFNVSESEAFSDAQRARLLRRLGDRLTRAGDLVVHTGRHRERSRNRTLARERLAELLLDGLATRRRRVATKPSRASKKRVRETKQRRSTLKRTRGPVKRDAD